MIIAGVVVVALAAGAVDVALAAACLCLAAIVVVQNNNMQNIAYMTNTMQRSAFIPK